MPRGRVVVTVAAVVVAVVAVTVGVTLLRPGSTDVEPGAQAVDFTGEEPLWAQGSTVHLGDRAYDVGSSFVHGLVPSSYGVFLEVARKPGYDVLTRWVLFDGERTHELPGDPDFVEVSADGRYAGWIDREGPRRLMGRLAEVVVVDLRSGDTVLRTHEGMGDLTDDLDDLYEELEPRFLGFDAEDRAYWSNATGSGERRRADLATGRTEAAERDAPEGYEGSTIPIGTIVDPRRGSSVSVRQGRVVPESDGLPGAWLSPGGRWLLGTDATGVRPRVTDARTGAVVRLDLPGRGIYAGSWLGPDAVSFLVTERRLEGFDVSLEGGPSGTLVRCTLPAGACTETAQVDDALTVVLPGGSIPEDGLL